VVRVMESFDRDARALRGRRRELDLLRTGNGLVQRRAVALRASVREYGAGRRG